jgi:hypothetical protein
MENARDKKRLNKKVKELTISRDQWKDKSIGHKSRADKWEADFQKLKKKLIEMVDIQ